MNETTPLKAVRLKCLRCCLGSFREVELCPAVGCPLHPFRFGKIPAGMTRGDIGKAIIARCRDCAGDGQGAIENCGIAAANLRHAAANLRHSEQCPLYGFRPAHQSQQRARRRLALALPSPRGEKRA